MSTGSLVRHYYQYLEEYITMTHSTYSKSGNAVYCDYYSLDKDASVWDENYVASYQDIGDLSGLRWNKVSLFPVFFGEGAPASLTGNEKGTTREESIRPTVMVPRTADLEPKLQDYIVFTNLQGETLVYQVVNLDYSMPNNRAHFKLQLFPSHHEIADIEAKVSSRYVYNDVLDIINTQDIGIPLFNITNVMFAVDHYIRTTYFFRRLDCVLENNLCIVDLNYYLNWLSDNFPTSKIELYNLAQEEFKVAPAFADSAFGLLFDSSYVAASYSLLGANLEETNMSNTLFHRWKPLVGIAIKGGSAGGIGTADLFATMYMGTAYVDVVLALNNLLTYRQGGVYTPSTSTVALPAMINQLVTLEEAGTLPSNYQKQSTNLVEAVFEIAFFKQACEFAITNKITGL